ncbi:DNA-packaging protein [Clostridium sporogenes]|uniref:DNA-packaging protein n=1 Tax=Clostridium tepidum TaxID=1962263 RepID=A0A1S9I242_9CLOT|nr:head-tail connector protein [Clostridium tepidum]KOY67280.1 DNA-packaging protein [Clostridium sporogenes]MDU6879036.1 head-tail connector protein [Clostridium botulinum]OOO64394.1 DNA-packaging protein [Clostridium tepidum]
MLKICVWEVINIITLQEVKEYLRVDYDDEDNFLQLCIINAEGYLKDSIDNFEIKIKSERFKNKARLIMMAIIQDMFDNRDLTTKENEKYKLIVNYFLLQMKYSTYD